MGSLVWALTFFEGIRSAVPCAVGVFNYNGVMVSELGAQGPIGDVNPAYLDIQKPSELG